MPQSYIFYSGYTEAQPNFLSIKKSTLGKLRRCFDKFRNRYDAENR